MRIFIATFFLCFSFPLYAQLGFCEGSKGDPIFQENFGTGSSTGPELPPGTTSYTYVTGDPQDGEYTVSDGIGRGIFSWHQYLPGGSISGGRALIVNADFTSGRFYRTTISGLCENTTYEFSAYLMNIYNRSSPVCSAGGIPVNVRFEIWDASDTRLLKEASTGAIPSTTSPRWEQYALTFQSISGQDSVILKMFNNGEGGCGNDLAIDDIIFRSCGDLTLIEAEAVSGNKLEICETEAPVSLNFKATPDFSVYDRHFYQWQESSNGEDWQDIPGAGDPEYTSPQLTSSAYYRVKIAEDPANLDNSLCSSASESFFLNIVGIPQAPVSNGDRESCSDEPIPVLSVSVGTNERVEWYDSPAGGNLLSEGSSYRPGAQGVFYAEAVKSVAGCRSGDRTAVSLMIHPSPPKDDEVLQLCEGGSLILDAGAEDMIYRWSTGENIRRISVEEPGNYRVEISTREGCSSTRDFEVQKVIPAAIREISSQGLEVRVLPLTEGVFEYSLNGVDFQRENSFTVNRGGVYTAYMRDIYGCNTVSRKFPHIVVPAFFTPNNDGYNDHFVLRGVEFFNSSQIRIFDRYGKLIKAGKGESFRWDGTFNGVALPADDYWYEISIESYESIKGNVSLKR